MLLLCLVLAHLVCERGLACLLYFAYPRDRPQVAQVQKRIKEMQALGKKVTVNGIKTHYHLSCSAATIKERIFKSMGQKWLRRSHKPGVPADCTEDCTGSVSSIGAKR